MAGDLYGFDEQSVRRIGNAVRNSEAMQPDAVQGARPAINRLQVYTFVRSTPSPLDDVAAETFNAVQVSTVLGYDFQSLNVTCEQPRVEIPANAPRVAINQSLIEGCIFHGDIFQAVNVGGSWHAIGTAHTSIRGTYDSGDGVLVLDDCNGQRVPVQSALSGFGLIDGETYVAEWLRADRVYVAVAVGCTEDVAGGGTQGGGGVENPPVDCNGCTFDCLTATIPGFTISASSCTVPETTLTFSLFDNGTFCNYPVDSNPYFTTNSSISWTGAYWRLTFGVAATGGANCPVGTGTVTYKCDTCTGDYVYESKQYSGESGFPAGPITVSGC